MSATFPRCATLLALWAGVALTACSPREPEQGTASVPGSSQGTQSSQSDPGATGSVATRGSSTGNGGTGTGGTQTAPTFPGVAVTPGTSTTPTASGSGTDANTGGTTSASAGAQAAGSDAASGTSGSGTAAKTQAASGVDATTGTTSARSGGGTALATGDRTFVVNAAAASMTEVEAGRMAAAKAADASVKAYGQMLAEQHGKSGEELVRFAKLHNVPVPEDLPAARRQMISRLDEASGSEFDRMFIDLVGIKSHEETIRMFESASRDSKDAELKAWIDRTLPLLHEHLTQAQKLPSGGARGSSGAKTG